jgi:arylsulfatase A-like enzyme
VNRKNVIVLHADQLRYDCLGSSGNRFVRTPNLDRLAATGAVFTRHITSNPICMPSRASLLTGLYPPGHNVWTNGVALNRKTYNKTTTLDWVKEPMTPEPATLAATPRHADRVKEMLALLRQKTLECYNPILRREGPW